MAWVFPSFLFDPFLNDSLSIADNITNSTQGRRLGQRRRRRGLGGGRERGGGEEEDEGPDLGRRQPRHERRSREDRDGEDQHLPRLRQEARRREQGGGEIRFLYLYTCNQLFRLTF